MCTMPMIDMAKTGQNIVNLRKQAGMSVKDLQDAFGFGTPQAIYKWQRGKSLPSVDNLYALSALLDVSMDDIIVSRTIQLNRYNDEQQAAACCSAFYCPAVLDTAVFRSALTIFRPAYTGPVGYTGTY